MFSCSLVELKINSNYAKFMSKILESNFDCIGLHFSHRSEKNNYINRIIIFDIYTGSLRYVGKSEFIFTSNIILHTRITSLKSVFYRKSISIFGNNIYNNNTLETDKLKTMVYNIISDKTTFITSPIKIITKILKTQIFGDYHTPGYKNISKILIDSNIYVSNNYTDFMEDITSNDEEFMKDNTLLKMVFDDMYNNIIIKNNFDDNMIKNILFLEEKTNKNDICFKEPGLIIRLNNNKKLILFKTDPDLSPLSLNDLYYLLNYLQLLVNKEDKYRKLLDATIDELAKRNI